MAVVGSYPLLVAQVPVNLKPGSKYLVRVPQFPEGGSGSQFAANQTGASVLLTHRITHLQFLLTVSTFSKYVIDGSVYSAIQLANQATGNVLLLYEGLDGEIDLNLPYKVGGDYFNAVVAASTAVTKRSTFTAPGNVEVPLTLNYSLSAGGDIVGTAGDDWYIMLTNESDDSQSIIVNRGSVSGSLRSIGGQTWYLQYANGDTVAHRMAGAFHWIVGRY